MKHTISYDFDFCKSCITWKPKDYFRENNKSCISCMTTSKKNRTGTHTLNRIKCSVCGGVTNHYIISYKTRKLSIKSDNLICQKCGDKKAAHKVFTKYEREKLSHRFKIPKSEVTDKMVELSLEQEEMKSILMKAGRVLDGTT